MAGNPRVLGLLEEILDEGKTPEEVCRGCPELLSEVRKRWLEFRVIDEHVVALLPGLRTTPGGNPIAPLLTAPDLLQIPGYEVQAVLGRGGMGVVYKARQRVLDREVAVKMLATGPFAGPQELGRFRRETAALASLRHPNIVQVFDAGDAEGCPYFAMEFVEGGSLARQLAGTPQPARRAAGLLATLAGAVQVAHEAGIVHRDLKPANVLLTADGTPKVSDFGLARPLAGGEGLTRSGAAVGTPSYMSPEQAEGKPGTIGAATDVYSLGAILYECLTGRPPFRGESDLVTVYQVVTQEPVPPSRLNPGVPRDLETICLKCLHKQPPGRYPSAAALAEDLHRFGRGDPIAARPAGRLERLARRARRRPATTGLSAAVALLVLVAAVGTGLQYRQWATARDRRAQTDREVRGILERARDLRAGAWEAQDLTQLTAVLAEANRAVDVARSGATGADVWREAETFRADADEKLTRTKSNAALREAVLDLTRLPRGGTPEPDRAGRTTARAQTEVDEEYAAAFRQWGLDVDHTPEDEAAAKLGAEPDAVVTEFIAALDGWMLERRRLGRPEGEWRRLFRVANRLDRGERRRWLRSLLVGEAPPRAASVAALAGPGISWPALWVLACGDAWQQLRSVRGEIDPRTDPAPTVMLLAQTYVAVGDPAWAEKVLREAVAARPDQAMLLDAIAKLLEFRGPARRGKAIEYYRAARALQPRLGISLCAALILDRRENEAEEVLRDLLRRQPERPTLHNLLGICLDLQNKPAAAEAAYRAAIALAPDYASAHSNLGLCLADQHRYEAAERAAREAIDRRPNWSDGHFFLGDILAREGKHAEAEEAFSAVIARQSDRADAHYNLGNALTAQAKHAEAEAAYRRAIDFKPDFGPAYNNLGMSLNRQRKTGAADAFRRAVSLAPDFAVAHNNLGMTQAEQGKYREAETAYRCAIAAAPAFSIAHFNLAHAVGEQGRFDEALAIANKGNDLLPAKSPLRAMARPLLLRYQRCLDLEARLPAVLRGADQPANPAEITDFAEVCLLKKCGAAAARLYGEAFAKDPKLAEDVPAGRRYNAACACALAGCERGKDADRLDAREHVRLRRQALAWLHQDLAWWAQAIERGNAQTRARLLQKVSAWRTDDDLAGLRDPEAIAALSPEERRDCLDLWDEVTAVISRAQSTR
jgi:serine/threonine-protein kinase